MGENEQLCLLASDAGYGFVTKLEELYTKNRSGKAILKLPQGSLALAPKLIADYDSQHLAIMTKQGHLLVFPLSYLPQLPRGKGNKMVQIPPALIAKREDYVIDIAVLNEGDSLVLYSGKRSLTLKPSDLAYYQGERGRRGNLLPRGFRQVDCLSIQEK
jgi:topoisomerase-4 subunit A